MGGRFPEKGFTVAGARRCLERNSSLPRIQRSEKGLSQNHTMARKGDAQSQPWYFTRIGVRIAKSGQFSVSGFQERFEVCSRAGRFHSHGSISQSYTRHTFLHRKLPARYSTGQRTFFLSSLPGRLPELKQIARIGC